MTSLSPMSSDAEFTVVRRGYDRAQVDEQMERLTIELRTAAAARDSAVKELDAASRRLESRQGELQAARSEGAQRRADADALRAQVAELSTIPHTVDGMSERLQQMVRIAQDEVNDMRTRATTSASHVLALAQAEADELRERSEKERQDFESERRTAQEALRGQLKEGQARLEQMRSEADGQRAGLNAELTERRGAADRQLTDEMDERRAAMLGDLATHDAGRREEAGRIVDSAAQQARNQLADADTETQRIRAEARADVAAAQRELQDLRALQHQVSEQLTSVRALLDWTLPQMPGAHSAYASPAPPAAPVIPAPVIPAQATPAQAFPTQTTSPPNRTPVSQGTTPPAPPAGPDAGNGRVTVTSGDSTPVAARGQAPAPAAADGGTEQQSRPSPAARPNRLAAADGRG